MYYCHVFPPDAKFECMCERNKEKRQGFWEEQTIEIEYQLLQT
jgi:hypothetical protein